MNDCFGKLSGKIRSQIYEPLYQVCAGETPAPLGDGDLAGGASGRPPRASLHAHFHRVALIARAHHGEPVAAPG